MSASPASRRTRPAFTAASSAIAVLGFALGASALPAHAADRDVVLRFLPPTDAPVTGYQVYAVDDTQAEQILDLGFVSPDSDGVARTTVVLDSERAYDVGMTAYNEYGESEVSNLIFVPADAPVCVPDLCDDDNACTADSCDDGGCFSIPVPEGTLCDDGYSGTIGDQCIQGICQGTLLVCQDDSECDDGDVCNGIEICDGGTLCLEGVAPDCGDATQCSIPRCDARDGCWTELLPDGTECDDGRADTVEDACYAGICQGVTAPPPPADPLPLAVESVDPPLLSAGRHTIAILGSGFTDGARVSFRNGEGRTPRVRRLTLVDDGTLEVTAHFWAPKRPGVWDVFVTLPDGREVGLGQALRVER